jgi:NAD(P)-dependent dehydrogenase (short-subunit alcohol dehydrogenase family)
MAEEIEIPERFPAAGDVTGKRVVITGASRGLGRVLAHAFSQAGARVVLVARVEKDLKEVAGELPSPTLVCSGDVTDAGFNEAVADSAVAEWGGIDVWICNAGISPVVASPLKIDPSVWRQVLEVNLTGAFLGARAAAGVMRDGGRLIFTGSVLGDRPSEGLSAYCTSKAGLVGLAKALALDLAWSPRGGSTRRWPRGGRATPSWPSGSSTTRPSAAGAAPPTWPAPTDFWRPMRRRS